MCCYTHVHILRLSIYIHLYMSELDSSSSHIQYMYVHVHLHTTLYSIHTMYIYTCVYIPHWLIVLFFYRDIEYVNETAQNQPLVCGSIDVDIN